MILDGWSGHVPAPGERFVVHYVADGHDVPPDLAAFTRSLDRRPGVAVKEVTAEGSTGIAVNLIVFPDGDLTLLQILGTFHNDGSDNFWRVEVVERVDSGRLSGVEVILGRVTDAILDPVQDVTSAAEVTARETVSDVRKFGVPSLAIIGVAVVAFLLARSG